MLYGPDLRTRIRPESSAVLFGAWCPTDLTVAVVERHLTTLAGLLRRQWPDATIEDPGIRSATDRH